MHSLGQGAWTVCRTLDNMGTKTNQSLFSWKTRHNFSFYLSRAYRDSTLQTTQYNGLCHVTLSVSVTSHLPSSVNYQASRSTNPPLERNTQTPCTTNNTNTKHTQSHIFDHIPKWSTLMSSGRDADTMSEWPQMGESWSVLPTCT